jgi:hypothetical protein
MEEFDMILGLKKNISHMEAADWRIFLMKELAVVKAAKIIECRYNW